MEKENVEYVICKLCNHCFKHLGWHLIKIHKLSVQEYRKLFPKASILSESYKEKLVLRSLKRKKQAEERKQVRDEMKKENIDYVVCQFCNKHFNSVSMHLKRTHNSSIQIYKEAFSECCYYI